MAEEYIRHNQSNMCKCPERSRHSNHLFWALTGLSLEGCLSLVLSETSKLSIRSMVEKRGLLSLSRRFPSSRCDKTSTTSSSLVATEFLIGWPISRSLMQVGIPSTQSSPTKSSKELQSINRCTKLVEQCQMRLLHKQRSRNHSTIWLLWSSHLRICKFTWTIGRSLHVLRTISSRSKK